MTRQLPARPNVKQLRNQARDILHAHEQNDASCCGVLRYLRHFSAKSDEQILSGPVRLTQFQFALAMEYGFRTWKELTAYVSQKEDLESIYLTYDEPMKQSGFHGSAEQWRRERGTILDAMDRDGDFLDVGCANGLLAQSLAEWGKERGVTLTPYGLDQGARLVELAKQRLPEHADHFWVGDVWNWQPSRTFDYVYVLWDIVPESFLRECLVRLADTCLRENGRLILGAYGSVRRRIPARDVTALLEDYGLPVLGSAASDDLPTTHVAWTTRQRSHTDNVARYYTARAPEYDTTAGYEDPDGEALREPIKEAYQRLFAGHDVLEVACGTGYWTEVVARTARSVLATDVNEDVLAQARARTASLGNVECQNADAYTLESVPAGFTAACAIWWWSHMPKSRVADFLRALHAKLAPGAIVLFGDNLHCMRDGAQVRTDAEGNRLEERVLNDGRHLWVVKNFPTEDEIREHLAGIADDLTYTLNADETRWEVRYRVVP